MYEYAVYCAVISLICTIMYFDPILTKAINSGVKNTITMNPQRSLIIWQITAMVLAPVFTLMFIVPNGSKNFKEGFYKKVCNTK